MISCSQKKKYVIHQQIGSGSYGKVYLAKCISTDELCVIKKIKLTKKKDSKIIQNEVSILEQMDNKQIIKFQDFFYDNKLNEACVVMEYAEGGNLEEMIKKQNGKLFNESKVLQIFFQICDALKYIHAKKILHRDLKTENVFLTKNNDVKLGDFGVAKILNYNNNNTNTFCGTPYYLSPELIKQMPYSFKNDIWALGIILYRMCTFDYPFKGEHLPSLASNILRGEYKDVSAQYSKFIHQTIRSLLTVDGDKRPSIEELFDSPQFVNEIELSLKLKPLNQQKQLLISKIGEPKTPRSIRTGYKLPKGLPDLSEDINSEQTLTKKPSYNKFSPNKVPNNNNIIFNYFYNFNNYFKDAKPSAPKTKINVKLDMQKEYRPSTPNFRIEVPTNNQDILNSNNAAFVITEESLLVTDVSETINTCRSNSRDISDNKLHIVGKGIFNRPETALPNRALMRPNRHRPQNPKTPQNPKSSRRHYEFIVQTKVNEPLQYKKNYTKKQKSKSPDKSNKLTPHCRHRSEL